jgi:excisionase family DNA binding protein
MDIEPVLVPVWPAAGKALGVGRTKVFELVASGALRSVRVGRRRLVPVAELRAYAERLSQEAGCAA